MKKTLFLVIAFLVFCSHDMFLKLNTYFLQANTSVSIMLFNGTFEKSDNVIARDRMLDVSLLSNGVRTRLDTTQWSEKDSMTILDFKTGDEGTYVVGVSTKARNIELDAEAFNSYLEHDGVLDMIEWRKENNELEKDAVEKYSKHVKTIFQVGNKKTDDWKTVMNYPIEFVPLVNPYELHTGDEIRIRLLSKGKPMENQLVYIGSQASANGHTHDHGAEESDHEHGSDGHSHTSGNNTRTDSDGVFSMKLTSDGIWYARTINLIISEEAGLTHESNWATLTFEVGHDHESVSEQHVHQDESPFGIPSYVYLLGSFALVGILFFLFYRNSKNEDK